LEEAAVPAGRTVLKEGDDNILLIVGDLQGILDQHLWPHTMTLLNIIVILIIILNYI
jgi:hypothetical protein